LLWKSAQADLNFLKQKPQLLASSLVVVAASLLAAGGLAAQPPAPGGCLLKQQCAHRSVARPAARSNNRLKASKTERTSH
jgi:hypothetical protein